MTIAVPHAWRSRLACLRSTGLRRAAAALTAMLALQVAAQPAPPAPAPGPAPAAASAPAAGARNAAPPQPIAPSDIAPQAEAAAATLAEIEPETAADETLRATQAALPELRRDLQARQAELGRLLARAPSIDTLRTLEATWRDLEGRATDLTRELTRQGGRLDERLAALDRLEATWKLTRESVRAAGTPAGLSEQVERVLGEVGRARRALADRRAALLALQGQIAQMAGQAREARSAVRRARDQAGAQLLERDRPPIWRAGLRDTTAEQFAQQSGQTLSQQLDALGVYAADRADDFLLHAAFAALCVGVLWAIRRPVRRWVRREGELNQAARVLEAPLSTGLLTALLASGLFHGQAPPLWWSIVGVASVVPTVILTRRVIEPRLYPVLYALVSFYLVDQFRLVAVAPESPASRLFFLGEMLAGIAALGWRLLAMRGADGGQAAAPAQPAAAAMPHEAALWSNAETASGADAPPARRSGGLAAWLGTAPGQSPVRLLQLGARLMLALLAAAVVLDALGFGRLGGLIGTATISSAYLAIVFHAGVRVGDGLVAGLLQVRPLSLLEMVRKHRPAIALRLQRALRWLAAIVWLLIALDLFAVRQRLADWLQRVLDAPVRLGSIEFTLGSVGIFVLTLWAAWLVSRTVRFVLEEEFYPRARLARGLTYAISTVLHYAILVIGIVLAIAALGVDMTRFTILAGAFSVGLGFGLQNIVNNFVSGLIVLFERPIEVGDLVQMGDSTGTVERIGIRASVIRTANGAAIVVPNGKLLSDQLTNWTLSSRLRRIDVAVLVDLARDPEEVMRLLAEVARANAHVAKSPPPEVLFLKPGPEKLEFELRAWTREVERAQSIRSELVVAINRLVAPAPAPDSAPTPVAAPVPPAPASAIGPAPPPASATLEST